MERITFFERYRISVDDAGKPREISRSGSSITYRAVDLQSGEAVALKIIPITSIDSTAREQLQERARSAQHVEHENVARLLAFIPDKDDYVFISELTHGETIAQWVATHGPLAPDATLRTALQVVSALQSAAFHGLTHSAIEPSNIVIVPGVANDGGWPAIKLLNLDSAGVPIVSPEQHAPLVGTAAAPQFAAPEQLRNGTTDFRSEIYSLGATICFMLTGLAPLGVKASGETGDAKLPSNLRRMPRSVRELLLDMLRPNPEDRPQDPVAFGERIRRVLGSLQRRRPARREIAPAAVAPVAAPFEYRSPSAMRPLAIAAGLAVFAVIATMLIAQPIRAIWRRHHDVSQIGVPVGVPDAQASPAAVVQSSPPQPAATAPEVAAANTQAPAAQQPAAQQPAVVQSVPDANEPPPADAPPPAPSAPAVSTEGENARVAENQTTQAAAPPAEGPSRPEPVSSTPVESNDTQVAAATPANQEQSASPTTHSAKKTTSNPNRRTASTAREKTAPAAPQRETQTARFVGTTRNGEWIFEAPSGDAILDMPNEGDERRSSKRHRRQREQINRQVMPAEAVEPEVRRALPPDDDDDD